MTCFDLINYNKAVGGLNRVSTIINELSDEINVNNVDSIIFEYAQNADLQRLGYLWQYVMDQNNLADKLFALLKDQLPTIRSYKLTTSKPPNNSRVKNRWNINANTTIEIDE